MKPTTFLVLLFILRLIYLPFALMYGAIAIPVYLLYSGFLGFGAIIYEIIYFITDPLKSLYKLLGPEYGRKWILIENITFATKREAFKGLISYLRRQIVDW